MNLATVRRVLRFQFVKTVVTHPPRLVDCPICDARRLYIQTNRGKLVGRRCIVCSGTLCHQATYSVIQDLFGKDLRRLTSAYELSAHGALYRALRRKSRACGFKFTCSEFLDEWTPGHTYNGVRCENVEALTFPDNTFDLVTSTGMFEHVENDAQGYREICRVLKPGGYTVFSVPFQALTNTLVHAVRRPDGSIEHLVPARYHSDPFRGENAVFVWRSYGPDIIDNLAGAGLASHVRHVEICGRRVPVIVGRKPQQESRTSDVAGTKQVEGYA
jgi:SAM-dependent methyltransferase